MWLPTQLRHHPADLDHSAEELNPPLGSTSAAPKIKAGATAYSPDGGKSKVARVEERTKENPHAYQRFRESYPPVLTNRLHEEDWLAIVRKVNEFWGPIADESHKVNKLDGLLSYTLLSVPVHMAKQRRLEHAATAARRHITFFLDKINEDVRDSHISFSFKEKDPGEGAGMYIEIMRSKTKTRHLSLCINTDRDAARGGSSIRTSPTKSSAEPLVSPRSSSSSSSSSTKKWKPQFLKREEKWWHFSNDDILAALEKGDEAGHRQAEEASSSIKSPRQQQEQQVSSPPSKSPRGHSPGSKGKKKSPKAKQSPPEKQPQQPERRARSNTLDSQQHQHLHQPQPITISTPPSPYQQPQFVAHSQPHVQTVGQTYMQQPLYVQQPPVFVYPVQQHHQQQVAFVPAGQYYPGAHLQPVPQPVVFQQHPTPYGAAPSDWAAHGGSSLAPPVHRARSQSTGTHEQRDLITW